MDEKPTKYQKKNKKRRKEGTVSNGELLRAFMLAYRYPDGTPLIPESMRDKNVKEMRKLFQVDHRIALALGGLHHPSNMQPLTQEDHKRKTRRDIAAIAKVRRLAKARAQKEEENAKFRSKVLAKSSVLDETKPRATTQKKKWPKGKPMGWRRFDGTPVHPSRKT